MSAAELEAVAEAELLAAQYRRAGSGTQVAGRFHTLRKAPGKFLLAGIRSLAARLSFLAGTCIEAGLPMRLLGTGSLDTLLLAGILCRTAASHKFLAGKRNWDMFLLQALGTGSLAVLLLAGTARSLEAFLLFRAGRCIMAVFQRFLAGTGNWDMFLLTAAGTGSLDFLSLAGSLSSRN